MENTGNQWAGLGVDVHFHDLNPCPFPLAPCIPGALSDFPLCCPLLAKPVSSTSYASSQAPQRHRISLLLTWSQMSPVKLHLSPLLLSRIETMSPIQQCISAPSFSFTMEELLTNSTMGCIWRVLGITGTVWFVAVCHGRCLCGSRKCALEQELLIGGPSMCEFLWTERPRLQLSSYSQGYL